MINLDKYKVIEEDNIGSLEIEVNDYINKGYEPIGGIAIYRADDTLLSYDKFYQAMYKKD